MSYKIMNLTIGNIILEKVEIANSFFTRLKGLLGRERLEKKEGLIIKPCNSVHTIGMKFPIDVAFVNNDDEIIHIIYSMFPGKFSHVIKNSKYVIEVNAGVFRNQGLKIGDKIKIYI